MKRVIILLVSFILLGCFEKDKNLPAKENTVEEEKVYEEIKCTRFNINYSIEGDNLIVNLDTDLPDFTNVLLEVNRDISTDRIDNIDTYPNWYYSDNITVGQLKDSILVDISNELYLKYYMFNVEIPKEYKITEISDNIRISMLVPENQSNEAYDRHNKNLTGQYVRDSVFGQRILEKQIYINHPLEGNPFNL